jgi:tetratricopeptide (TPR) repeat protein
MKIPRTRSAAPRVPRRWRTPPPITRGNESLEGMEILREIGGEVGVLLWQSYRNVMFWAGAEPGERAGLFSDRAAGRRLDELAAAHVPQPLQEPLTVIAAILSEPEEAPADAIAGACTAIARWAEAEQHPGAALEFTQAAAVAAQRNPRLSLAVGHLARRRGDLPRAETWFRHSIMIARQVGDWDSYGRAYIALGNMLVRRGNFPAAQRMHVKALRAARRKGLQEVAAMALHDLFGIAVETGRGVAEEHARQAFRAYGPRHPRLPMLAHDVAYHWIQQGHFDRGFEVLRALEPSIRDPHDRMTVAASLGRASGGAGDAETFQKTWAQVTRLSREPGMQGLLPGCLLDLALGAASLGDWDRAASAAREAAQLATREQQAKVHLRAEALVEEIASARSTERVLAGSRPTEPSPRIDALAGDLVRTLERFGTATPA